MTAKKKVVKITTPKETKPEIDISAFWGISNDLEDLSCKVGCLGNVAELLAANLSVEPESGAAWALVDMIRTYTNEIEKISQKCIDLHRRSKGLE